MRVVQAVGIFALGMVGGTALGFWLKKPAVLVATAAQEVRAIKPTSEPTTAANSTHKLSRAWYGPLSEEDEQLAETVRDPRAWLETWVASGAPAEKSALACAMVARWAESDVMAALQFVSQTQRFPDRARALPAPLAILAAKDLATAERWIADNMTLQERRMICPAVIMQIGQDNPAGALRLAFAPGFPVERELFGELIGQLARTDSASAVSFFNQLSEEGRRTNVRKLVLQWYEVDPAATLRWVQSQSGLPHGTKTATAYVQAVATFAPNNLPQALHSLSLKPEELSSSSMDFFTLSADAKLALLPHVPLEDRRMLLSDIMDEEVQRSPDLAWKLARESLGDTEAAKLFGGAWQSWQSSDRKAAQDWLATVRDPAMQAALAHTVRFVAATDNPQAFLASINPSNPDPNDEALVERALSEIDNSDPTEAATWITKLGAAVSNRAVTAVSMSWMERDEAAALQWINGLAAGQQRDAALAGAAHHWMQHEDLSKVSLAIANVSNSDQRVQLLWAAMQRAYRSNRDTATQWLATQPVSQEVKDNWLMILRGRW